MNKKIFCRSLIIFLIVGIIRIIPSSIELLTADSCTYLDIARNIAIRNGLFTSYNLYQFWPNQFYPALIYIPPIFPILLAIIWKFFHSVQAAILLNVFICGFNCALLYLILERMYQNTRISFWAAILISISKPMFLTSINVWTEQLHLLFLLVAVFIFFKDLSIKKTQLMIVGFILGFSFLIRASIYNLLVFLIVIFFNFGRNKKTLWAMSYLILGFFMVVLPYQLFCILKFNAIYPQYFKANTIGYLKARLIGGYYQPDNIPVLRANEATFDFVIRFLFKMMPLWVGTTLKEIFVDFGILFYFLILRLLFPLSSNDRADIKIKEKFFITLALVNFIAHAVTLYWHPWFNLKEVARFNLITYVFLVPVALAYFYKLLGNFNIRFKVAKLYYVGLLFMFIPMVSNVGSFYTEINLYKQKKELRLMAFDWIRDNTKSSEIIATSEIQEAFELHRPVVSLPPDKVLTKSNMEDFLSIYKPSYIIVTRDAFLKYRDILRNFVDLISVNEKWNEFYLIFRLKNGF